MTPEPQTHSIRERIMQHLKARFEGAPIDGNDVSWGIVTRKQIKRSSTQDEYFVLGLYDTFERITEGAGWELRNINVVFEFHVQLAEDDEPSTFLNHCLGQVVRRVGQDIQLGGLALNCRQTGAELDIEGAFEKYVSGVVAFDVSYRCRANDPYTPV